MTCTDHINGGCANPSIDGFLCDPSLCGKTEPEVKGYEMKKSNIAKLIDSQEESPPKPPEPESIEPKLNNGWWF